MKKQEMNFEKKQAPSPRFHMEIEGTRRCVSMLVYGVRHIEEYKNEMLVLQISGGRISLRGEALSVSVFENKCVEIRGKLSEVAFSDDRT